MSVTCELSIPRESEEFIALYVLLDKVEILDYETAFVKGSARPSTWTAAVTVDARTGLVLHDLSPGQWTIFVRVLGTIVEEVMTFTVT